MKTGLIPNHNNMNLGFNFLFKLSEKCINRICVQIRGQQPCRLPGLWTGGSKDIKMTIVQDGASLKCRGANFFMTDGITK